MTREDAILVLHDMKDTYDEIHENTNGDIGYEQMTALDMAIKALQDRPHGEWIDREHCQVDEDAYEIATCSHCKAEITLEYPNDNFCPNCGAIMKGGAE